MKEALVRVGLKVDIVDSPIPRPGRDQVLIKVVVSGSNPKDWKYVEWHGKSGEGNNGDDIAGIVHEVGEDVYEFKKGDRVAAFHQMFTPGGSWAEYALAWKHTTFHLPGNVSFEEGASLPLAALTAVVGLYDRLRIAHPWVPYVDGASSPLLVYGGSSAVGSYALQLLRRSNVHPLIVVAGNGAAHVEQFLDRSKGDTIVDYRSGDVVEGIQKALQGAKLLHVFDATSTPDSLRHIAKVIDPAGTVTTVLPEKGAGGFADSVRVDLTKVGDVHTPVCQDIGFIFSRYLSRGLEEGWFTAHPQEVIPGGLAGVQEGLERLKAGKNSALKYVFKIADTPGLVSG